MSEELASRLFKHATMAPGSPAYGDVYYIIRGRDCHERNSFFGMEGRIAIYTHQWLFLTPDNNHISLARLINTQQKRIDELEKIIIATSKEARKPLGSGMNTSRAFDIIRNAETRKELAEKITRLLNELTHKTEALKILDKEIS